MNQIFIKNIFRNYKNSLILIYCIINSMFLPSCVTVAPTGKRIEPTVYQSDYYIIYELHDSETSEYLAGKYLGDEKKAWKIEEANRETTFAAGQHIIIPLQERNKGGISSEGYQVVPILTYHRFGKKCDSNLCIPRHIFEKQMKYLKDNGYHSITPEELLAFLDYREALPEKSVMITMDDGYRSVYNIAVPIMKKYGFTATFFIYTNFVGVSGSAITWDQLRDMKANGFSIGSHSVAHSDLSKKTKDESEEDFFARIKKEVIDSKAIIDKKLGQDTIIFAYPFGRYDQRVIDYSINAGYKMAVTVERGGNAFFSDPMILKRDQILSEDMQIFHSRLNILNRHKME